MKIAAITVLALICIQMAWAGGEALTLDRALSEALLVNPDLAASRARARAERAAIRAQYSPDNPKIGLMREKNLGAPMETMDSWSISQEIKFPVKYFLMGSLQRRRAEASDQAVLAKRLEVRGKLIASYYSLYAADRMIGLLEAQRETLRQVARIAESRYATGAVSQQDQMKAHVEQVKVENDLLMIKQERDSMAATMNALLNREPAESIRLPETDLPFPVLASSADASLNSIAATSQRVKASELSVKEAAANGALSKWDYAPDIMLSYRKPFTAAADDAYAFSVELSVPFWFFMKQTSAVTAASNRADESEKAHEMILRDTSAEARSLYLKVKSNGSLLKIYETSLIPLVTNTLNSSQGAYRAGKSGFIELLDSERALYETRIGYYRTLTQYVDALVHLEQTVGRSLSSLPMGDAL